MEGSKKNSLIFVILWLDDRLLRFTFLRRNNFYLIDLVDASKGWMWLPWRIGIYVLEGIMITVLIKIDNKPHGFMEDGRREKMRK